MRKNLLIACLVAAISVACLGCGSGETQNAPVTEKPTGSAKTPAKGMSPDSLALPAGQDGKGNFGSKAGGN